MIACGCHTSKISLLISNSNHILNCTKLFSERTVFFRRWFLACQRKLKVRENYIHSGLPILHDAGRIAMCAQSAAQIFLPKTLRACFVGGHSVPCRNRITFLPTNFAQGSDRREALTQGVTRPGPLPCVHTTMPMNLFREQHCMLNPLTFF